MLRKALSALLLTVVAAPVSATVVYQNTFDVENGGLAVDDYTGFAGLSISAGSVDLVGASTGIACASGLCVDLAGTAGGQNGITTNLIQYHAGDTVSFEFLLGGDQTNSAEPFSVAVDFAGGGYVSAIGGTIAGWTFEGPPSSTPLGSFGTSGSVLSGDPFSLQTLYFKALQDGYASFSIKTYPTLTVSGPFGAPSFSDDESGPLIDDVVVRITSSVPEPTTWALMVFAFGLVGATLRSASYNGAVGSGAEGRARA